MPMPMPPLAGRFVRRAVWQLARPRGLRRLLDLLAQEIDEATGQRNGGKSTRTRYQMRRPLPMGERSSVDFESFRPNQDESELEGLIRRAFVWAPERDVWSLERIRAVQKEHWFEPGGVLLHRSEGRIDGVCWTRPRVEERPPVGEIMLLAVDPDAGGRGLGRQLVLAGLDLLHRRGFEWGMLYVDATNIRAVKLYVDLGFAVTRIEREYGSAPPTVR